MAMKTLVKNCPFCKKVVEQRAYASWGRKPSEEDKWLFGTPLKLCPHCGKLEFFSGKAEVDGYGGSELPQRTCPKCGAEHDFDYPKCPLCGYVYGTKDEF